MNSDRGLAMWRAIEEVVRQWDSNTDVFAVGEAGGHVVVIRVHEIDPAIFASRVRYDRVGTSGT